MFPGSAAPAALPYNQPTLPSAYKFHTLLRRLDWFARSVHHRSVRTVRWPLQEMLFLLAPDDAAMIPLYSSEDPQNPVLSRILGLSLFRFTDGIDFARS